jgi:hypothetical protein
MILNQSKLNNLSLRNVKQKELSSSLHQDGFYKQNTKKASNDVEVVDFVVVGLPPNMTGQELKEIVGAKHLISSEADTNTVTNECTGTGRFKFRETNGQKKKDVKEKLISLGFKVSDPKPCTQKNSNYTDLVGDWKNVHIEAASRRHPGGTFVDAKSSKIATLASNSDVFGNTNGGYTQDFHQNAAYDKSE